MLGWDASAAATPGMRTSASWQMRMPRPSRRAIVVVACLVLGLGVWVETLGGTRPVDGLMDWTIGAAFVLAALGSGTGAWSGIWLGLATAVTWFLATFVVDAPAPLPALAGVTVLVHRAFLMHWITRHSLGPRPDGAPRALIVAGYVTSLVPTRAGSLGTAVVALCLAATLVRAGRSHPADLRRTMRDASVFLTLLAAAWSIASLDVAAGELVVALPLLLLATAWHLSRPPAAVEDAVGRLVIELAPSDRPPTPLTTALSKALADPELRVAIHHPATGWADETGRPVADPVAGRDPGSFTDRSFGDAGRVVLLHGPHGAGDTEFAGAAAAAAGLGLGRMRLDAELRHEVAQIQNSTDRLMAVDDTQRRALAERLREGAGARMERLRQSWLSQPDNDALVSELDRITADLERLTHGLAPNAADPGVLPESLEHLARGIGLPVEVQIDPGLRHLTPQTSALLYYVAAECLTNVSRHANARVARLEACLAGSVRVEVLDDGSGGASQNLSGGLRSLADRVSHSGGTLTVDSPLGGPTRITAQIPVPPATASLTPADPDRR